MRAITRWMIDNLGYNRSVEILKFFTFQAGLLAGVILTLMVLSGVFFSAERRNDLKKVSIARIRLENGKEQIYFNPQTISEVFKSLFIYIGWKLGFFSSKHIYFQHAKSTKILWYSAITLILTLFVMGILLTLTVPDPNDIMAKVYTAQK